MRFLCSFWALGCIAARTSAGRSLLGSWIGLQGLGCADQYQGPAILVFRRRLHLIARKIEDDGSGPAQRKMEGIPIDRDLAVANPEEAPEVS